MLVCIYGHYPILGNFEKHVHAFLENLSYKSQKTSERDAIGGVLTLKGDKGMCRRHDPLFSGQSALPSLPICHKCIALVPPICNFRKTCFWPKFQLKTQNFRIFAPKTPHFFQGKPAPKTLLLETPEAHIHKKKKKVECPPPTWGL